MSEINHAERGHSKLGASSMERWAVCPASVRDSEGLENKSSIYAAEGTSAHELGEKALLEDKNAADYLGETISGFEVTEEMAEAVQMYVDFIRENGQGKEVILEQKFDLAYIDPELYGTSDAVIMEEFGTIHIIDYKHGVNVVEAVENRQLMYYCLGAMQDGEYGDVKLSIVQPRADHPEGRIRTWETTIERLEEFEKELKAAVKATREDEPKYQVSEKGCKYCLAKATCPAMKEMAMSTAMVEFDDDFGMTELPKPNSLTKEQVVEVLNNSKLISGWLDAVSAYAQAALESGEKVEGYKLVKKRANRKWKDESAVIEEFGGIYEDGDLYAPRKLKSPAQLEKLVGKADVAKLTETPDTGHTMVTVRDKRKAIELIEAKDEFND